MSEQLENRSAMDSANPWYVKYTYILAGLILTVYAMIVAKSILIPLLFALFFSILLSPICGWMESYKVPRIVAALTTLILASLFVVGIGFFFYTQLLDFVDDVDMITERIGGLMESSEQFLATWFGIELMVEFENARDTIINFIRENSGRLTTGIAEAASVITATFLIPVFMFFFLIFRDFLKDFLLMAASKYDAGTTQNMETIINKVKSLVQSYIAGLLIVIFILSIINSVMLLIVGVNHALFFGVFAAMLNVIPFLGPIMGSILPIIYALVTMDSLIYPIIILLAFYVIQLFESNLFTPVIVGSQVSMNALSTLLLLFIGAQIWGLVGMILFIPIGAILKAVFDEIDSLKPYGYLLGRVPKDKTSQKGPIAEKIHNISEKAKEKVPLKKN